MMLDLQDVSAWTPVTAKHYRDALRRLREWCERTGRDTARLTDRDLSIWVAHQSTSPSATRLTLAAVGAAYATRGQHSPAGQLTHIAIRNQVRSSPPGKVKHAINVVQLRTLVQLAPPAIACGAVVCWHGAFRIGELESATVLSLTDKVAIVHVNGKSGPRQQRIIGAKAPDLCPLYWLREHPPTTWTGMRAQLVKWAKHAGLPTQTHAYRRGWAMEAARQGVSALAISMYLGHTDARAALAYVGAAALEDVPPLC